MPRVRIILNVPKRISGVLREPGFVLLDGPAASEVTTKDIDLALLRNEARAVEVTVTRKSADDK